LIGALIAVLSLGGAAYVFRDDLVMRMDVAEQ